MTKSKNKKSPWKFDKRTIRKQEPNDHWYTSLFRSYFLPDVNIVFRLSPLRAYIYYQNCLYREKALIYPSMWEGMMKVV